MKYIDAELLRKEIEFAKSVYSNPKRVIHGVADAFRQDGRAAMCDDILKKLDTLPEQPVEIDVDKEWDELQRYFHEINEAFEEGRKSTAKKPEQPVDRLEEAENEEFEKELHRYWLEQKQKGVIVDGSLDDYITVQEVARHFAEWGVKHLKK